MRTKLVAWAIALSLSFTAARGQQFHEWSFQAPAGWQMTQDGGTALLSPPDARTGAVYFRLFPAQKMSGDLQSWLEQRVQEETRGLTVLQNRPAAPVQTGGMQKLLAFQQSNGQKFVRMYIAQSPVAGTGELMVFHADADVATRYTPVMNGFIASVRFSNAQAGTEPAAPIAPVQQAPGATGYTGLVNGGTALEGWYAKATTRVMPGANFTTSVKTVWKFYRFFPNGWAYTSMPQQGDLNAVQCPQAGMGEEKCQQYAIRGSMITIGSDGPKSFEPVPGPDGEIRVSGVGMWPVRPLPGPLLGEYEAVSGSGMMGTQSLRINGMTFYSGGRFAGSQSTSVASTTSNTAAGAYRSGGNAGQFTVNGYELELQFSNGSHSTTRIVAPTQDMDMLVIGGTVYMRKGAR